MNHRRIVRFVVATLILCSSVLIAAPDAKPVASFKDGDTICFVGDSITRGGWFHAYILQFYATRFPQMKLRTFNCGKSGDNAVGTLGRLPWDCLQNKPNVAVVMLGMNDATVGGKQDRPIANLEKLIVALQQAGCRVIQVGPTIYEETAQLTKPAAAGKQAALADYSLRVREMAGRLGNDFVDFNAPMQQINMERQKADPKFTLVGSDRVHPGEPGHLVMAYEFLRAQQMPRDVSRMVIDAAPSSVVEQGNCKIGSLTAIDTGLKFICTENSLPYVPTDASKPALEMVPFTQELNNETLLVRNLHAGNYELKIDDQIVGVYSNTELGQGINLAINPKTPQYQQSLKITQANVKRHGIESVSLRGVALVHGMLKNNKIDPADEAAAEKYLKDFIAAHANDKTNFGKTMAERYLQSWNKDRAKNEAMVDELMETIHKLVMPVAHRWELSRKG